MDYLEIAKVLALITIGGGGGFGLFGAIYKWRTEKPKNEADVQKVIAEITVTHASALKEFTDTVVARLEQAEQRIEELQTKLYDQGKYYRSLLDERERAFYELQAKNYKLEQRVAYLEGEVERLEKSKTTTGLIMPPRAEPST